MASAGCRKMAGVPVLLSVAAILCAMMPDLPMPVRTTRPRQHWRSSTARWNRSSRRSTSARMAAASVSRTRRARARSTMDGSGGALGNPVDRGEPLEQRPDAIEAQRVLCVAPGARRILVHLEEHAVDARGDARARKGLDVLGEPGRHTVAGARPLQAVGHVE